MVKILPSNAGGSDFISGWENKIAHAWGPKNQNIKQKQCCNKLHKGDLHSLVHGPFLMSLKPLLPLFHLISCLSYLPYKKRLCLAALGLHCSMRAFSTCSEQGLLFTAASRFLTAVSPLVEHRLQALGLQQSQRVGWQLQLPGSTVQAQ